MNEEKMLALADKIKNGKAGDDEKLEFFKMFNELLRSLRDDLKKDN